MAQSGEYGSDSARRASIHADHQGTIRVNPTESGDGSSSADVPGMIHTPYGTGGNDRKSCSPGGGVSPALARPPASPEPSPSSGEQGYCSRSAHGDLLQNRLDAERFGDLAFDFVEEACQSEKFESWAYGAARTAARFGLAALDGYARRAQEIRW